MCIVVVVVVFRLSGFTAFSTSDEDLYQHILSGTVEYPSAVWSHIDPLGVDLVKKLLVVDVNKRLSVGAALRHPWCVKGLSLLREQGGPLGEMAGAELDFQTKTMGPTLVLEAGENRFKKVSDVKEDVGEGGFIRDVDEEGENVSKKDCVNDVCECTEPPEKKTKH